MRSVSVTVGPSLTSTANNICTSQTPAGSSGQAAVTFTGGSATIAATNTLIAGQPVTFSTVGSATSKDGGTLPTGFVPNLTYYVISTSLSSSQFQVSQTPGGTAVVPGSNTLTGTQYVNYTNVMALNGTLASNGVATLSTTAAQRVLITTADSTTTFTLYGMGPMSANQSETLVSNGTSVQSALDYYTIIKITVNQQPTAAVTVGTNGVGSSPWVAFDEFADAQVSIQCDVTGTVNYTIQVSNDATDANSPSIQVKPSSVVWINTNDTNAVNATASLQSNFLFAPRFARILLNSGSGSVVGKFIQYGMVAY